MNSLVELITAWNEFSDTIKYCLYWILWKHEALPGMNYLITLSTVWNQFSGTIRYCQEWVFPITLSTVWNEITEIFWVLFGITLSTNFNEISEILTTVWNELSGRITFGIEFSDNINCCLEWPIFSTW